MDLLFEIIMELFLEGSIEINSNERVSKWIRYPILVMLILFFTIITSGMLILGIYFIKENIVMSIILIICSLLLLMGSIIKLKSVYRTRK